MAKEEYYSINSNIIIKYKTKLEINKKTFQTHDLILMAAILNLVIFS